METKIDKIEELLELGIGMGSGKRFLLVYEGELAITNRVGLANWPSGRREIVAQLDATDCLHGPTSRKWDEILEKLRTIESRKQTMLNALSPWVARFRWSFVSAKCEGGLFVLGEEEIGQRIR